MSFSSLFARTRPAYEIPDDDLVGEVLVPAMRSCDEVRIGVGFFTSRCLAQVAPGLASFVNDASAPLDLMVSPEISGEDRAAIHRGIREPQTVLDEAVRHLFEEARLSHSAIERHTVETLAYLVASRRLRMRVVLMDQGMYHKKIWLFRSGTCWLAVHGSGNATERGLLVNGEQMSIDRAWTDGPQSEARVEIFLRQWDRQWGNHHPTSLTVDVAQALELLRSYAGDTPPTTTDFWEAWRRDHDSGLEPELPSGTRFSFIVHRLQIPNGLVWREGRYAHQGQAVNALIKHNGGLLSIATGGGKTRTALITASEIQNLTARHLCVVILAPTRPLIRQWKAEVQAFGIDPIILTGMGSRDRQAELERASVSFDTNEPRTEVFLMSNALFTRSDSAVRIWLETLPESVERFLIADEVHNLGAPSFVGNPPEFFDRRIGLSATPIRQYDPDGTHHLFDFFGGPPVFEFSLGDAIKAGCLVPYRYYIHVVEFNSREREYYEHLTEELVRAGFRIDDDGVTVALTPKIERLLRERRALVEQADAKLSGLEHELRRLGTGSISKTLIYTSAKPTVLGKRKQITAVNEILEYLHIISHQYTAEESRSPQSQKILDRFGAGDYQVLTAMKVLDEGVDIPQTDSAFLLASSTVEREWVQRRGRILRNAPDKKIAHLHDFLVVSPDFDTPTGQSLLKSELRRASEFASLAENEFDPDGPNAVVRQFEERLWKDRHG